MKTRNPIVEIRLGVAASRQSAANFLFLSKKCGALPRRRYAVLEKALLVAAS
jgi:hypothetical protein